MNDRKMGSGKKINYGRGKLLLMDDNDDFIIELEEMVRYLGYEVESVKDGLRVIEVYTRAKETGRPFDAVILDLTIAGGFGGEATIHKLREIDPDVKAIIISGYSNDPVISEFKEFGFSGAIIKPFEIKELSDVLHKIVTS